MVDSYFREAVNSFQAAFESFQEFFVKFVWRKKGFSNEVINDAFSPISRQSERVLGAYLSEHLHLFGKPANFLASSKVKFRNEVIHKGKIPTEVQALSYSEAVAEIILPILKEIKVEHPDDVSKEIGNIVHNRNLIARVNENNNRLRINVGSNATFLSLVQADESAEFRSIRQEIDRIKKWRNLMAQSGLLLDNS